MKSRTTPEFWGCFKALPPDVQRVAVRAFAHWRENPHYPGLHFKRLRGSIWSVRVGMRWRAIGDLENETVTWFWVGSHTEYDRLIG